MKSQVVLFRIWEDGKKVQCLHSDATLSYVELEALIDWSQQRISDKKAMGQKQ